MSDNPIHVAKIAREIKLQPSQVRAVRALLADDATVPFIARYRKEVSGSLTTFGMLTKSINVWVG